MATIEISASDVADAQNFLQQFLSDTIPEGDFSSGTALNDLTVGALAAIYALFTRESGLIRAQQSLSTIEASVVTAGTDDLAEVVTAYLSNWFIKPKAGQYARGAAVLHVSQLTDIVIPTDVRFTRTTGVNFRVDSLEAYTVLSSDLYPVYDTDGTVIEYTATVPVIAMAVGTAYNVEPGIFSAYTRFSPYVTSVDHEDAFAGGRGSETVEELLARAPTAITTRNLINEKSIQTVLADNFATESQDILVVGTGETEMQRDVVDDFAQHLAFHVGGATDIYYNAPLVEQTFTAQIGAAYDRNDRLAIILKNEDNVDYTALQNPVLPGYVIRILGGIPGAPREYSVREVYPTYLVVSRRVPFAATTEGKGVGGVNNYVSYTVGNNAPSFNNCNPGAIPWTKGVTSYRNATPGAVQLPPVPIVDITDVAITNPGVLPFGESAYKDPIDGFIRFDTRVNVPPVSAQSPNDPLQYQVVTLNPQEAQSSRHVMLLRVGPETNPTRYENAQLRIKYKTVSGYESVAAFVSSRAERVACASQLTRGFNPVKVGVTMTYRISPTASTVFDELTATRRLSDFINAFDTRILPLDASALITVLRESVEIAAVLETTIQYKLFAPNGAVIAYETDDEVRIEPAKLVTGQVGIDVDLSRLGVSDRTVRYFTTPDDINLVDSGVYLP